MLVRTVLKLLKPFMPAEGFEPPTNGLQSRRTIVARVIDLAREYATELFLIVTFLVIFWGCFWLAFLFAGNT